MRAPFSVLRRARVCPLGSALLLLVAGSAPCRAGDPSPLGGEIMQKPVWTVVEYDDRGPLDFNALPTPAERERSVVFFGPTTNVLADLLLPWNERLLNRIHEPSVYLLRTNAARQEYRLVFMPSRNTPVVLHFRCDGSQSTLQVYNWRRRDAAFLSEAPLVTTLRVPSSRWEALAQRLKTTGFWEKPACLEWWSVKDGYKVFLEVLDRGRYRLVCRASGEDDEFETLCRSLLDSAPELPTQ